jgi:hypothetical protein
MPNRPARPPIDLRLSDGEIWLPIRVQPKASRDQLRVEPDGRVKASITAPPAEGEANAALCKLLARHFGVSKTAVRVVRGEKSREKIVALRGTTLEEVRAKLSEIAES